MSLSKIFAKQGGFKLISRYIRNGVFGTALAEFITLGKDTKALEILRLAVEYKTKKKLEKKYVRLLEQLQEQYDSSLPNRQSKKVWVCWFQGIESAPALVKRCYNSLVSNLHNREVTLITYENMHEYVTFPDYIIEKWKKGVITHTHMTDLLRLELLIRYGGTWIDATVLCTQDESTIPPYFFESDLFFFQTLKPGRDGVALFLSSWFISAHSNNRILWLTRALCYEYWKTHNYIADYYLFHDFMCMVLEKNQQDWDAVIPRDNASPHILLLRLFERYEENLFWSIITQTPFHKLSYKLDEKELEIVDTFYQKIMND